MLKIQNLSYAYKKIQALKDVSFSLQDGEIMIQQKKLLLQMAEWVR